MAAILSGGGGGWRPLAREMLDLVHPPVCVACGVPERDSDLCGSCRRKTPLLASACPTCADPAREPSAPRCLLCRSGPPPVPLRVVGWHEGVLRDLILAAKWRGEHAPFSLLARWAVEAAAPGGFTDDLDGWSAIPRDRWRWLLHGVSLGERLGRTVGRELGLRPVRPARRLPRPPQSRLRGAERRRNLRGTFRYPGSAPLAGRGLLLIDDVYTTGSTLEEAARAARAAGAREVKAVVIAVTPP